MIGSKRRLAILGLVVAATLVSATPASSAPSVASKQAEAERVLAQIQELDANLGLAVEAYNAAEVRLEEIRAEQRENQRRLEIARANYADAQAALQERLIALYESDSATVVEILLAAESLDDFLTRVDTVSRVSQQDARIIREIEAFRAEIKRREAELEEARVRQAQLVAERAARRADIEAQLAERQRLLSSIKDQIARIQAAEAARQRRLEEQARERLSQSPPTSSASGDSSAAPDDSSAEPEVGSGSPPPSTHGGVVGIAMRYLGIPYKWGGSSPSTGFDCSGFVMYVYAQVGVSLPHNAAMQYGYGSPVSRSQLQPGDLVFFNGLGHNGIYIGGNQFIHSPHTGDVVKISSITGWYADTWVGGRRL
ncbi:MAG: NlpC/P60 family protein [Actinomycetota bacterium]|nr:NlpC/P60 family protein [Actinomycetota bacterium]